MSGAPVLLALDTSCPIGSVAVGRGGELLGRALLEQRTEHAARVIPAIEQVLEEVAVERTALGGVVIGEGPGSFTGVRVAAATAKGLVRALAVPMWPVSPERTSLPGSTSAGRSFPLFADCS